MKRFQQRVLMPFLVLGIAPVCGADEPPSLQKLGLKGNIRSVIESDLADNISPSEPKGTPFHVRTFRFSPDGYAISSEDCVSTCERSYFTWQGGRLVEERHESENGLPERRAVYVWDADGRLAEERTFDEGDLLCRKQYIYDGSSEQETWYCPDTAVKRRVKVPDGDTNSDNVSVFHYLEDRKEFKLVSQHEEKTVKLANGATRTESKFSGGTTSITRDAESRLLETVNDFRDSYHCETHRYDAMGREIEKAEWNRDGSIINRSIYIYSTDSLGNWTRRTEMFSSSAMNEPVEGEVTVRSIDYY